VKTIRLICSKIADAVIEGRAEAFSGEAAAAKSVVEEGREDSVEILGSYTFEPEEPDKLEGEIAST